MQEAISVLSAYVEQRRMQAKQCEDQRATMTNYLLVVCTALQGFIANRGFDGPSLALAGFIVIIGVYGMKVTAKYYERFRLQISYVDGATARLRKLCPDAQLMEIEQHAREQHISTFGKLTDLRLNALWSWPHIGLIAVGIVNILMVSVKWLCS